MATATPIHGSKARLYANALDLTPFTTTVTSTEQNDSAETTGMGATATTKVTDPRIKGMLTAAGYFVASNTSNGTTGGTVHDSMKLAEGVDGSFIAHCIQDVLGANAGWCYGSVDKYQVQSATKAVNAFNIEAQSNVGIDWSEILHPALGTVETTAGNSSGVDDGAAADLTGGGILYLMVLALTGTSITPKLQSSTTVGGTYADVSGGAFTAVAAANAGTLAGCQRLVIPSGTTINRAVRAAWTGTFSSAQFLMAFKRL